MKILCCFESLCLKIQFFCITNFEVASLEKEENKQFPIFYFSDEQFPIFYFSDAFVLLVTETLKDEGCMYY